MIRTFARAAAAVASLAIFSAPVFAHVTLETPQARIGSAYKAVIRVPHGCDGQATQTLRVQVPEGFFDVKPMPKAGWDLTTEKGPYAQSYDNHGTPITEGVKEIVWSGGNLPDDWYDEFIFQGTFAGSLQPGAFYFPTVQECADGEEAWTDVSGSHGAGMAAPSVELIMGEAGAGHHAHGADAASEPAAQTIGDIEISGVFSRATLPNAPVGGGFLTITNKGTTDDVLVSASAPIAGDTQLHEMSMEGDVMKMRPLGTGIAVPAGQTVTLAPGGLHIMFMGLKARLEQGQTIPLTLTFEKAGTITLDMPVGSPAADAPAEGGHDMSKMGHDMSKMGH